MIDQDVEDLARWLDDTWRMFTTEENRAKWPTFESRSLEVQRIYRNVATELLTNPPPCLRGADKPIIVG